MLDAAETFELQYEDAEVLAARERVRAVIELGASQYSSQYTADLARDISLLWQHNTTQATVKRKNGGKYIYSFLC